MFQALEIQGWTNETKAMFSWACILVGERDKKQMYGINVQYTAAIEKSKAREGDKKGRGRCFRWLVRRCSEEVLCEQRP